MIRTTLLLPIQCTYTLKCSNPVSTGGEDVPVKVMTPLRDKKDSPIPTELTKSLKAVVTNTRESARGRGRSRGTGRDRGRDHGRGSERGRRCGMCFDQKLNNVMGAVFGNERCPSIVNDIVQ